MTCHARPSAAVPSAPSNDALAARPAAAATLQLPAGSGFALEAARRFLAGFTPGCGMAAADDGAASGRLRLAFRLDGNHAKVVADVRERPRGGLLCAHGGEPGRLEVTVHGPREAAAVAAAGRQVARILAIEPADEHGGAWVRLGERDPRVGRLQALFPGLRPVSFPSAYEAGLWALLAQRLALPQAAALRRWLIAEHGDTVTTTDGETVGLVPAPARLREVAEAVVTGQPEAGPRGAIPIEKWRRLAALAGAAMTGELDTERLRLLPVQEALGRLQAIRGVGPWTAQMILMRGSGVADALPTAEPRVRRALAAVLEAPLDDAALEAAAEGWRPYRMWVSFLAMCALNRSGQWQHPDDRLRRRLLLRPALRGPGRSARAGQR